jgi:hypothetical protein
LVQTVRGVHVLSPLHWPWLALQTWPAAQVVGQSTLPPQPSPILPQ